MHHRLRGAALAAALAASAAPGGAQQEFGPVVNAPGPAVTAFAAKMLTLKDYTCVSTVDEHTNDGAKTEFRGYEIRWLAPGFATTYIYSGAGKGNVGAWRGGPKMRGRTGTLRIIVSIHDPRATSMRGNTIDMGLYPFDLGMLVNKPGTLTEAPGPILDDQDTTIVTNVFKDPEPKGETKVVETISNSLHLPIEYDAYVGDQEVVKETYTDIKTDVGVKLGDINVDSPRL